MSGFSMEKLLNELDTTPPKQIDYLKESAIILKEKWSEHQVIDSTSLQLDSLTRFAVALGYYRVEGTMFGLQGYVQGMTGKPMSFSMMQQLHNADFVWRYGDSHIVSCGFRCDMTRWDNACSQKLVVTTYIQKNKKHPMGFSVQKHQIKFAI